MDFYLYIGIVLLIQSIIMLNIMKKDAKPKSKILKLTKIHYINLLYGKKGEFDKKAMPIFLGLIVIGLVVFDILLYWIYGSSISISSIIAEIFIVLSMTIMWKAYNKEITVYLCEDGIYYQNIFISWDKFKETKNENGFIKLIGKGKIFSQRIYLKYENEIENIIKSQIEKFREE
ncbi:hypothetical protein JH146_1204 [Methanocaldococcus bathoardescens]|uniref:DUF5673 domain-containing protein n=1 Tax=Methanocaldococcus bathoardescens TaxID=1301915 RepID=A0A076LCZ9_9EURY|nr:hypothetical protein [Methanocaldococcus bathoardescens]AIJ06046.1 hypothetical protein JH146_1204 [Methanocaldococcus bathoardescens]